jgi:hypothetical protein
VVSVGTVILGIAYSVAVVAAGAARGEFQDSYWAVAEVLVLLGAPVMVSCNDSYLAVFGADQVNAQAMLEITAFNDIWYVGQFLFGLHLLLIGYLAYRSGYVPRLLGVLIAISGLGYAADSLGAVLSQGSWTDITSFTFIGEFLLALWLLIRARRIAESTSTLDQEPLTVSR